MGDSVAWDGRQLRYYEHEPRRRDPALREAGPLVAEWLRYWPGRNRRVAR